MLKLYQAPCNLMTLFSCFWFPSDQFISPWFLYLCMLAVLVPVSCPWGTGDVFPPLFILLVVSYG